MPITKRAIAVMQLVLIFPAALFMSALVARTLQPLLYEPAHTAQLIVMWYSGRVWTLWILLAGLPFAVLAIGCVALLKEWGTYVKPHLSASKASETVRVTPATLLIGAMSLAAGAILVVVGVHILMN